MKQITEFIFGDVSIDFSEDERVIIQDDDVKLDVESETFKQICIQYLCLECPDVIKFDGESETKPTYRYEKVEFEEDWEYFKLMSEDGDLYVNCVDSTFEGCYGDNINLANAIHDEVDLYRRIEVTGRELFIEEVSNLADRFAAWKGLEPVDDLDRDFFGYLFDSGIYSTQGSLNIVNGKG